MNYNTLFLIFFFFMLFSSANALTETSLFGDNFSSGGLVGWDNNAGVWSAATFQLVGGALDPSMISHTVPNMVPGRTYRMYYKNDPNVAGLNNEFFWFTDQNGVADINGYSLLIQSGTTILRKYTNGTATSLTAVAGTSTGVLHDVNISNTYDGNITVFIDGVTKITVTDTTYQRGNRIGFSTSNGVGNGIWDDVNVFFTGDSNTLFRIVDEVSSSPIQATMTMNGVAWPVGPDGVFDVNAGLSFPLTMVVSNSGYDTRTFSFDSNAGLYLNNKFGLRTASQASDIDFIFYAPDETTLIRNQMIVVLKAGIVSGRAKTDSSGRVNFNLAPQDSGYTFKILSSGSDVTTQYTYTSVTVTVNRPTDEVSGSAIAGGFNIDVGGLGLQNYSNQSSFPFSTIFILGNTEDVYTMRVVDNNSSGQVYYARNYIMQTTGDTSTLTITPYLIKIIEGILVNITLVDLPTNLTIEGLRVTLTTGIAGSLTTVEDTLSDVLGIAQVVMVSQKDYTISVNSPNLDTNYFSGTISPETQAVTIVLNYSSSGINYTGKNILVSIGPPGTKLTPTGATQQIDFNLSTDYDINYFTVEALDKNIVRNTIRSTSNPFNSNFSITMNQFDSNQVLIRVTVTNPDSNTVVTKTYFILGSNNGGALGLRNLTQNYSTTSLATLIILLMIGTLFFIGQTPIGYGEASVFPVAFVGAMATYVLLPGIILYYMGALLLGGFAWLWVRSVR